MPRKKLFVFSLHHSSKQEKIDKLANPEKAARQQPKHACRIPSNVKSVKATKAKHARQPEDDDRST